MAHTLTTRLVERMRQYADRQALGVRRDGEWVTTTYGALDDITARLAGALLDLGLQRGDRVAIHAGNSPEWTMVDLACLRAGLVSVPVYTTSTPFQIAHILRDSGARVVFCGTPKLLESTRKAIAGEDDSDGLDGDFRLHLLDGRADGVPTLSQLLGAARPVEQIADLLDAVAVQLDQDDPVTIIYTSGTTGTPKGVTITHRNLLRQLEAVAAEFTFPTAGRNMSFLPLAHAYERGWTYCMLDAGMQNCSVTDPKKVADALKDIRPDVFTSVPRLYEKIYAGAVALAGSGLKRRVFDRSLAVGLEYETRRRHGRPVSRALRAQHVVADRLVLRNVRTVLGGGTYAMACGGAPLRREVEEFFYAAGQPVCLGYGLTETAPLISFNPPDRIKIGTAGLPIRGIEVRIAEDTDEILARGDNVTPGYWNRPEETAKAIDADGWFHTGDIGEIDEDGYLVITDRLKDLIVTMQGKNVAPGPIESAFAADPLVEAALVVGDGRPYLTALLQPSFDDLESHAKNNGWPASSREELLGSSEAQAYFEALVTKVGRHAAKYEQVQKFRLLGEPLSMDAGELTPTLKVRRRPVEEKYADLVTEMYEG